MLNSIKNKKCILFCRVSSREQEETGYSLPAQEKFLKDYCELHNLEIDKIFRISESASGKKVRKEFNLMFSYIKKTNRKIIVCEKVDRLTRSQRDAVNIDQWVSENNEHEVHFVKNSFVLNKESKASDKFVWNIHVSQAQFNIENLSEEVRKGLNLKLSEGYYPSNPVTGYKSSTIGKRKIIVPDEDVAQLIKQLFVEYSTGLHSVKSLCNYSKEIGLKNKNGNYISKSSMHLILNNPIYYGCFKWKGKIFAGKHEPIITKDLFDKVQTHLKRKTPFRYNKYDYLYKGILRCADCNRFITWESHKGHLYGYCKGCSAKKGVKEKEVYPPLIDFFVEAKIKDLTISSAIRDGIINYLENTIVTNTSTKESIESEILTYTTRLSQLYDDKCEGLVNRELYEFKYNEFNNAILDLKIKLKELPENNSSNDLHKFKEIFDFSQNMNKYYEYATDEEKRKLLKFVFKEIAYSNGSITYKLTDAFSLLYSAVELTNSSEIENSADLQNYISEPTDLVAVETKKAPYEAIRSSWLGNRDSNPNLRVQNPTCCHYTIPQYK